MHRMKGRIGFTALKIGLAEAYDSLNWKFIKGNIEVVGFLVNFVNVIMDYVTSPLMSVLWNGESTDSFAIEQGLCQG